MIWIIGGTSETREIEGLIKGDYVISVATEEAREFLKTENLVVGRMDREDMEDFVRRRKITGIVDLSHPYAKEVTENAKAISKAMGIPYYRYERPISNSYKGITSFTKLEDALEYIKGLKGTFLFTTGSKNAREIVKVRGDNRFIFRVLPSMESMKILKESSVQMRDIIGELGPFSKEQNLLTLREKGVDYMVTKDSGSKGGFREKMEAAREAGVKVILIAREEKKGMSLEEIVDLIGAYNK